ncbi:MAG: hypothetical protein RIB45_00085 [Marivibrio sp.]|uniref:hypothetical protein n=1 Tax=Marivibrio sp. TaxID=2039719 RepID=UPI0032EC7B48
MSDLKINDVRPRLQILQTDAGVRTFDLPFAVLHADHVKVAIDDGPPNQATYSVDRLTETDGARLTFEAAPPVGARISVWRDMPVERVTDFLDDGTFRASALNRELDRLTMLLQQLEARVEEGLRAAPSDLDQPLLLPPADVRANRILSFDADGAPETPAALNAIDVVAANLDDLRNYADTYLGAAASPPAARADGTPLQAGDLYYDATMQVLRVYDAGAGDWRHTHTPADSYLMRDGSAPMISPLDAPDVRVDGAAVWHAGNQGAGTGLDADMLDGLQSEAFALEADRAALEASLGRLETRLALNTLRDAIERGWSLFSMIDGFADAFADETGVDPAASVDPVYHASGAFYGPILSPGTDLWAPSDFATAPAEPPWDFRRTPDFVTAVHDGRQCWVGRTSGPSPWLAHHPFAAAQNDVLRDSEFLVFSIGFSGSAVQSGYAAYGNRFSVGWVDDQAAPTVRQEVGFYTNNGALVVQWNGVAWTVPNLSLVNNLWYDVELQVTKPSGCVAGPVSVELFVNGAPAGSNSGVIATAPPNASPWNGADSGFGWWHQHDGSPAHDGRVSSVVIGSAMTAAPFTLSSIAQSADAAPGSGRALVVAEPIDAVTPDQDLIVEISRDDGTSWSAAALADDGPYDAQSRIYTSDAVDLSGQPSGTAMRLRARAATAKNVRLHAWTLQWS